MFSLYGLTGPVFTGTLEQLNNVRPAVRVDPVRPVVLEEARGIGAEALHAYQIAIEADLERGPLYHAEQVMSRHVIVVMADNTVALAWRILRENGIHQAPVLDAERRLVGMFGDRVLLAALGADQAHLTQLLQRKVAEIMSSPVMTVDPVTDIRRVVRVMLDYGVDGAPVVDGNHALVGFVSRTDILKAVVADPPVSLWR